MHDDVEEVIQACKRWGERRAELDYDIDGVVVKVDAFRSAGRPGRRSAHDPRWAIAFKFAPTTATTHLQRDRA